VFVVPVTVAVNGTVCPSTTEVALGNTDTLIPVAFPLLVEDCPPLQPALHKMARIRRNFPLRPIVVPRTFIPKSVSMQVRGHCEFGFPG
jgi:hypothetical protein